MDPDFKTPSSQQNMQGVYGPTPPGVQQPNFEPVKPLGKSKRPFIIAGVIVAILVIGTVAALLLQGDPPKKTPSQNTEHSNSEAQGPQPATAVSAEQANNAISQEIGNLNDDVDFPADQLSDDNLDL